MFACFGGGGDEQRHPLSSPFKMQHHSKETEEREPLLLPGDHIDMEDVWLEKQRVVDKWAASVLQGLDGDQSSEIFPSGCGHGRILRIYCLADEGLSLTVRDGKLCLATTDMDDKHQHWVQDTRYGRAHGKDVRPNPAFALVNKETGAAIGISGDKDSHYHYQLKMVPSFYELRYQDESLLWTKDRRGGFRCIRWLNDDDMCLHFNGGAGGGSMTLRKAKRGEGCLLPWKCWNHVASKRRLWKMVPW